MSENISVSPTPIQRNELDVAMELLALHVNKVPVEAEEIGDLYAKYYSLAYILKKGKPNDLKQFLPEGMERKIFKA